MGPPGSPDFDPRHILTPERARTSSRTVTAGLQAPTRLSCPENGWPPAPGTQELTAPAAPGRASATDVIPRGLCTCTRRSRAGPACSHAPPARPPGPWALPVTAIVDLLRTASPGSFLGNDFQLPLLFVNGTILHLHGRPFPPSIDQRHRLPRRTDQQPFFPSSLGGTDGRVWWKEQASQGQQARVRILPALPTR